ncbi:cytidine deaminase [Aegicerativicinus sediminis]|uniref:cytidine deaminase n=1 Tax=Aegicerativicinus sediminis TaxID=2893202 RepID=UPI001E3DE8F8|nr:cytidine deaminase [Aegicerativicinus sediminis]
MKSIKIEAKFDVFENLEEVSSEIQNLMHNAIEARRKAYAPYSKFQVGAAILLENGEIITGSNQENASFPAGLCAERTAIHYVGAKYPDTKITTLAISAASQINNTITPVPPCGACRQAIAEYEVKQGSPIEIYFMGSTGKVVRSESLENLLPLMFDKTVL